MWPSDAFLRRVSVVDAVSPDERLVVARLAALAALPRAEAAAEEARLRGEVDAGHRLAWQHEAAVGEADPKLILDSRQERKERPLLFERPFLQRARAHPGELLDAEPLAEVPDEVVARLGQDQVGDHVEVVAREH